MAPPEYQWTNNVTVSGNVDIGDGTGFAFAGIDPTVKRGCPDDLCGFTGQILFDSNATVGGGTGFNLTLNGDYEEGSVIARRNIASGASEAGFSVSPGGACDGGFCPGAGTPTVQLLGNVAAGNGTGFVSIGTGPITGNTASGNSGAGFSVNAPVQEAFHGNSAIGNGGPGVVVNYSPDQFTVLPPDSGFSSFSHNNFYGNDRNRPMLLITPSFTPPNFNPGPGARCGVLNVGALGNLFVLPQPPPPPTVTLPAPNNFWGTTTGSSDTSGGACDQNGGVTMSQSLAGTPFPITSAY